MTKDHLPSASFCILPWTQLFADNLGQLYPCCLGPDPEQPIVDEQGQPFRLSADVNLEQAWNSSSYRELRKQMLRGERPAACAVCFRHEDLGMRSYRISSNHEYEGAMEALVSDLDPDGYAPLRFTSIDLRLGNRCNLKCRMCGPKASKGLIAEARELDPPMPEDELQKLQKLDWYEQRVVWERLSECSPTLRRLTFAGGEPLLIKHHFTMLRRLIDEGRASQVELHYITNATHLPDAIIDIWPHFAGVRLLISIDGFGAVNELIRYPTRWRKLDNNLRRLDAQAPELNIVEIDINTTVQLYNVLRLTELFDYLSDFERIAPFPNLYPLRLPEHLSVQVLPMELKKLAATRIESYIAAGPKLDHVRTSGRSWTKFRDKLEGVVELMFEADRSDQLARFLHNNTVQDRLRGQHLLAVIPELEPMMRGATQT